MATKLVYTLTYGSSPGYFGGTRNVLGDNFYKVGSSWYYACGLSSNLAAGLSTMRVLKASDPVGTWTVQDTSNEPDDSTSGFYLKSGVGHWGAGVDGDGGFVFHASYLEGPGTTDDVASVKFNTSTDTWANTGGREYNLASIPRGGSFVGQTIQLSGTAAVDGDLVVSYAGDTERVMGVEENRAHLAIYDSSANSWTTEILVDDSAVNDQAHYAPCRIAQSTVDEEVIHLFTMRDILTAGTDTNIWRGVYDLSTGLGTWNTSASPFDGLSQINRLRELVKTSNAREFIFLFVDSTSDYEIGSYTENATTGYPGAPSFTGAISSVLSTSIAFKQNTNTDVSTSPNNEEVKLVHDGSAAWIFYLNNSTPPDLKYIEYSDDTSWAASNAATHGTVQTLGGTASDDFALLGAQYDSTAGHFWLSWIEEEPSGTATNESRWYIKDFPEQPLSASGTPDTSTTTALGLAHPGNFGDLRQATEGAAQSGGTCSVTWPFPTKAGNLLTIAIAINSTNGDDTPNISGFTTAGDISNATITGWLRVLYKIADGTETTHSYTPTNSINSTMSAFEWVGPFDSTPLDKTATNAVTVGTTTLASGTTAAQTQTGNLAVVAQTVFNNTADFTSYSNSYEFSKESENASSGPTIFNGRKVLTDAAATSSTVTFDATSTGGLGAVQTFAPEAVRLPLLVHQTRRPPQQAAQQP